MEEWSHHDFGMDWELRSHFMDDVRHPFVEVRECLLVEADEIVDKRRGVLRKMKSSGYGDILKILVFRFEGGI